MQFLQWPWRLYNIYTHEIKSKTISTEFPGNIKRCVRQAEHVYVGHKLLQLAHVSNILFAEVENTRGQCTSYQYPLMTLCTSKRSAHPPLKKKTRGKETVPQVSALIIHLSSAHSTSHIPQRLPILSKSCYLSILIDILNQMDNWIIKHPVLLCVYRLFQPFWSKATTLQPSFCSYFLPINPCGWRLKASEWARVAHLIGHNISKELLFRAPGCRWAASGKGIGGDWRGRETFINLCWLQAILLQ